MVALTSNGSKTWSLGAYSNTTGFPRAVSFFEQRLVFAGSTSYPQTIWGSQSGIYENFDEGNAEAADAFIYTIAANKVNAIRWLAPSKDLIVGTAGSEFKVSRPTGEPLQPDNINIQQQTTYGVYPLRPIQIGNLILFVQRQQRKVRQFYYRFEDDAYTAPDMTILAEHITDTGIKEVDYAQEPDAIYWAVRNDGVLLGMTFNREEDVVAWHRHEFGGSIKYTFDGASAVTTNTDDANNNGYITISSHGFSTGDKITYETGGGTAIDGLEDGKEYYILIVHPEVAYDLFTLSDWQTAQREANVRGDENPLFKGALGIWDGVVVHSHEGVSTFNDGGGASIKGARNIFMGAQAACFADNSSMNWVEKTFDYGNQLGISAGKIYGVDIADYNSKDYGVIQYMTARTDL